MRTLLNDTASVGINAFISRYYSNGIMDCGLPVESYVPEFVFIYEDKNIVTADSCRKSYLKNRLIGARAVKFKGAPGYQILGTRKRIYLVIDAEKTQGNKFEWPLSPVIGIGTVDFTSVYPMIGRYSSMKSMFEGLTAENVLGLGRMDWSHMMDATRMFKDCLIQNTLDLHYNCSGESLKAENTFKNATIGTLDLSQCIIHNLNYDTPFVGCTIGNLDMSEIKIFGMGGVGLFRDANIHHLDLHDSEITDSKKLSFPFVGADIGNLNLQNSKLESIENIEGMFCASKIESMDISRMTIPNLENAVGMFDCATINKIDGWENVGKIGVDKGVDCKEMFQRCTTPVVNLSRFFKDVGYISCATRMFSGCDIDTLDISGLDFSSASGTENMFYNAKIGNLIARGVNIDLDDGGIEYTVKNTKSQIGNIIT
jgi:uncharacterized protein YjbI with pentapeptide repeats